MIELAIGLAALVVAIVAVVAIFASRTKGANETAALLDAQNSQFQGRLDEVMRVQGEVTGHIQGLAQRLDGFGVALGRSISATTVTTQESLAKLSERMALIDKADQTIAALSGQVVELQKILTNKQTRGAFGQRSMEAIIRDALPIGHFTFQKTLSNSTRPDCVVHFPNGQPGLVIDAKFPLEAWEAIRRADGPERLKTAQAQLKRDLLGHIRTIRTNYLVPGETQSTALMFIPSESIYADIQEHFEDVIQQGYRDGVMVVSPTVLLLAVRAVQSVLKDAQVREQVHIIRDQVGLLGQDVARLDERVRKLKTHFASANNDVDQILISTEKIVKRSDKIESLELPALEVGAGVETASLQELPFDQLEEA